MPPDNIDSANATSATDDCNGGQPAATHVRLMVAAWLGVMAAQAYLCRLSISVIATPIRLDLGLTESQMGLILGPVFFWTYAAAQIPSSRLGEYWGARISLPCFVCAWSIATALFGTVRSFPLLLIIWSVVGLSQAGAFPVAMRAIAAWFPPSERALASGSLASMMSVGAAVGAGLTGWLIGWIPWQTLFVIYAIPGLVWAGGFHRWFRNQPDEHRAVNRPELQLIRDEDIRDETSGTTILPAEREPTPWLSLATSWPMWMICGQQFCRAAAQVFFGSWFATFLQESRGITIAKSGFLTILPNVSIAVACLIGGGVADAVYRRTGRLDWSRKGLAVVSLMLCAALIFAAYFVQNATLAVVVISAGIFCAGMASPSAYAVTMDMGGRHVGAVFATMNMFGNIGAGMLPWLVPGFRRWVESTPLLWDACSHDSWNAVVMLVAFLYLTAATCWLLLPLRGTVFDDSFYRYATGVRTSGSEP